ncbi:hypothetical protein KY359_00405 [Candidatus Woesearchaeota archaeon]|nr:hypothetical protein [Candidatus Woesearchaeota archaeon]
MARRLNNRMFRSRKAFIFNIMIVIFTIIVLTYGYIQLSKKMEVRREIGANSMELINRIQDGEKALVFLDTAAQMAIYQAIYDLQSSGGITETSACGTYYGFNMWNSESGQSCFVDDSTAKDSLRDLFVSNLVARVAAYPHADFIGNVPTAAFSRGMAMAATMPMGVAAAPAPEGAGPICNNGEDFTRDFSFNSESGFFPPEGGRVWVPAEASCAGSYPLIIFLHGCMRASHATTHRSFGDSTPDDIIPLAKQLIQQRKSAPVIMAAPSQTVGSATFEGVPNSPCGGSLWGTEFDPNAFVDLVRANLPGGVTVSSVSFVGHSEAGCDSATGIHKAARDVASIFAVGQFDTCANADLGNSLRDKIGTGKKFMAVYAALGAERAAQRSAMGITAETQCPQTDIQGGELEECFANETNNYYAYKLRDSSPASHGIALRVGFEQFMRKFFSAGEISVEGNADINFDPEIPGAEEAAIEEAEDLSSPPEYAGDEETES